MANIRDLKKDIDYLVYEVISDCFAAMGSRQDEDISDNLAVIISDAIDLRNSLFSRVKYRAGSGSTQTPGQYYRELRLELFNGINSLFERISKTVSS